jgi:hypothetical protein
VQINKNKLRFLSSSHALTHKSRIYLCEKLGEHRAQKAVESKIKIITTTKNIYNNNHTLYTYLSQQNVKINE